MSITLNGTTGITTPGGNTTDDVTFGDNDKAIFGAGSDLSIYHDGTSSYISELGTGDLRLGGVNIRIGDNTSGASYIYATQNAEVTLYNNGSPKLATTSTGIAIPDDNNFSFGDGTSYIQGSGAADRIKFITAGSEAMRIDSSGNVGIGVTNPSAYYSTKLVVDAEGGEDGITIVSSNQAEAYLMFADGTSGDARYRGYVSYNHTSDFLRFGGTGAERMRIDSSGNLFVGKTANDIATVGHRLGGSGSYAAHSRSNEPALYVNRNSSDGNVLTITKDGTTIGSIGVGSGVMNVSGSAGKGLGYSTNLIYPSTGNSGAHDNAMDLGVSYARFDDIYATNGTIQTSDRNEKQDIASLTATEMLVAARISGLFKTFRWIDSVADKGEDARTHTGVIAQDVQSAFIAEGLDSGDYALFTSATWWETQTDVAAVEADEDNEIEAADAYTRTDTFDTLDEAPDGATERTRMGIRYPELLAFVGSYNEQRFASIETRLAALEAV